MGVFFAYREHFFSFLKPEKIKDKHTSFRRRKHSALALKIQVIKTIKYNIRNKLKASIYYINELITSNSI